MDRTPPVVLEPFTAQWAGAPKVQSKASPWLPALDPVCTWEHQEQVSLFCGVFLLVSKDNICLHTLSVSATISQRIWLANILVSNMALDQEPMK